MRKIIIILIFVTSNYCFALGIDSTCNKSIFFEDNIVMNDLSKEKDMLMPMINHLKEFTKNGISIKSAEDIGLPLNEEQIIKLLKCINVVTKNERKLIIVFVNRENSKILNMNIQDIKFDNSIYQPVSIEQFFTLLRNDKVEFKLKKVDGNSISANLDNKYLSDYYSENNSENNSKYNKIVDGVSYKYPLLFEEVNLHADVHWQKDIDTKNKATSIPQLKETHSMLDNSIFGKYTQEMNRSSYNNMTNQLTVHTNGRFEVNVELNGKIIKLVALIKTMTTVDDKTGDNSFCVEAYKVI